MQTKHNLLLLAGILLTLCLPVAANAQYAYDIVSLGNYHPNAINNNGQVACNLYSPIDQQYHAFKYNNGQFSDLFHTPVYSSYASGINDAGQIAGTYQSSASTLQSFLYNSQTGALNTMGTGQGSHAYAINQNGDVAGYFRFGTNGLTHAFIYSTSTGQLHDIDQNAGNPSGSSLSEATAINNLGQAAGMAIGPAVGVVAGPQYVFIYSNGVMQNIGTLPNSVGPTITGINNSGNVIGYALIPNNGVHGFLYRNGQMQDLSAALSLPGEGFADGINNAGDIIGQDGNGGFLYHNGAVKDLNSLIDPSLGWNIDGATAINDNGQIIGTGNLGGFIMTPHVAATPAPGSLLTFGMGMGALLLAARRKRNAAPRS